MKQRFDTSLSKQNQVLLHKVQKKNQRKHRKLKLNNVILKEYITWNATKIRRQTLHMKLLMIVPLCFGVYRVKHEKTFRKSTYDFLKPLSHIHKFWVRLTTTEYEFWIFKNRTQSCSKFVKCQEQTAGHDCSKTPARFGMTLVRFWYDRDVTAVRPWYDRDMNVVRHR